MRDELDAVGEELLSFPRVIWNAITKNLQPWLVYTYAPVAWLMCMIFVGIMVVVYDVIVGAILFLDYLMDRSHIFRRFVVNLGKLEYLFIKRSE